MSAPGLPMQNAAAGQPPALDSPTVGEEAVAQSKVASDGLAALDRVLALNGGRPDADDLKMLLMYVMTEGPQAPRADEMMQVLQQYNVQVPGANSNGGDDGEGS